MMRITRSDSKDFHILFRPLIKELFQHRHFPLKRNSLLKQRNQSRQTIHPIFGQFLIFIFDLITKAFELKFEHTLPTFEVRSNPLILQSNYPKTHEAKKTIPVS
jgi:hypothetical protein